VPRIVEVHPNDLLDRLTAIQGAGFILFDVVDLCYYDDRFAQADLVFLNAEIERREGIHTYTGEFDFTKWAKFSTPP
jgi:hypothetical protein